MRCFSLRLTGEPGESRQLIQLGPEQNLYHKQVLLLQYELKNTDTKFTFSIQIQKQFYRISTFHVDAFGGQLKEIQTAASFPPVTGR